MSWDWAGPTENLLCVKYRGPIFKRGRGTRETFRDPYWFITQGQRLDFFSFVC